MSKRTVQIVCDYDLTQEQRESLRELLDTCFPGFFKDRIFHKQIPSFRLFCKRGHQIIGHSGVTYRAVSVEGKAFEIFGLIDLCTHPNFRRQGVATLLIKQILALAKEKGIEHIFLFTDEGHDYYERHGFQELSVNCRWLAIESLNSHSILQKDISKIFMAHTTQPALFEGKNIDLLGELF